MKIVILLLGIFFLSFTSAIYAGECMEVNLSELDHSEDIFYIVTGNSLNLEGMNITLNSVTQNASICFVVNYCPDSFMITFFNKDKETIVEHHYSGGGGSSSCSYNEDFDWNCSDWSECVNETQNRTCKEYNNCHTTYGKPDETQSCSGGMVYVDNDVIVEDEIIEPPFKHPVYVKVLVGVILVLLIFSLWREYQRRKL